MINDILYLNYATACCVIKGSDRCSAEGILRASKCPVFLLKNWTFLVKGIGKIQEIFISALLDNPSFDLIQLVITFFGFGRLVSSFLIKKLDTLGLFNFGSAAVHFASNISNLAGVMRLKIINKKKPKNYLLFL
ncbi:hypothetical protein ACFPMF_16075 [Larkinella bovis]|uniref:Uncharacterized protein n=1 Tax=Larkinella bovis TaxID=683041 RepID=A0ABW0IE54_9BACT